MKVLLVALCLLFVHYACGDAELSDALLEQEFKKEDKDNSGGLSFEEVKAATIENGNGESIPDDILAMLEANFKEDDTDHDGALSLEEIKAKVHKNMKMAEEAPDA